MPQPKQRLRNLKVREISLVDDGDNPGARIILFKDRGPSAAEQELFGKAFHLPGQAASADDCPPGWRFDADRKVCVRTVSSARHPIDDDDDRQRRGERSRQRRLRRQPVRKATATTSSDGAEPHTHELEFPDGPIQAGRFITSEVQAHTHEVELPDLDPGDSFTLTTSLSDVPSPHTHEVTATAVESVINRGDRRIRRSRGGSTMEWLERFAKRLFEDIRDERMTEQVAEALMNRVGDLAQSVREIMFGPESMDDGFDPQRAIGETLTQLLQRAGGLTNLAYPEGAIFSRELLREREGEQIEQLLKQLRAEIAGIPGSASRDAVAAGQSAVQELEQTLKIPVISIIRLEDLIDMLEESSEYAEYLEPVLQYSKKYGTIS